MPQLTASLITLIAYIVVLAPLMLLGFFFARRKMFTPHHKLVMTSIVLLNWIFIGLVMARSFGSKVAPGFPDSIADISTLLPTIHLIVGGTAQLLATYLIVLMWTENTRFERLAIVRTRNIKPIMRTTLALWLLTILLGIGIYTVWKVKLPDNQNAPSPAVTEEAPDSSSIEEAGD